MTFIGMHLPAQAIAAPEKMAIECDEAALDFAAFTAWAAQMKHEVQKHSQPGERIALDCRRAGPLLAGFFGVIAAGRVATVVDPKVSVDLKTAQIGAASCSVVLDDDFIRQRLETPGAALRLNLAEARTAPIDGPSRDDGFYIGFTSGSTGKAKGFLRTHGSWLASFRVIEDILGFGANDRIFVPGPLTHSLHLFGAVHALHRGASVYAQSAFHPRRCLETLRRNKPTFGYATPTQLLTLAKLAGDETFPSVRTVMVGGAAWTPAMAETVQPLFPAADILSFYGASETSLISLKRPGEAAPQDSVGRPVTGVRIEARDGAGKRLPAGHPGLLWVASDQLFQDYVGEGSSRLKRAGDFISIGDHGYLDEEGYLFLTGRENRMIITSGVNVYPQEIEAVVQKVPAVKACAVGAVPDARRGQVPVVVVEPHADKPEIDTAHILRQARHELGAVKAPRAILMHEGPLPTTESGKIDYAAVDAFIERGAKVPS